MYSPIVWQHLKEPQNRGVLQDANAVGESRYSKCGDHLILQLRLDGGCIAEAKFLAKACAPVVATASLATELMVGLTSEQARSLSVLELDQRLGGLPTPKRHALWMVLECVVEALNNLKNNQEK